MSYTNFDSLYISRCITSSIKSFLKFYNAPVSINDDFNIFHMLLNKYPNFHEDFIQSLSSRDLARFTTVYGESYYKIKDVNYNLDLVTNLDLVKIDIQWIIDAIPDKRVVEFIKDLLSD